MKRIALAAVTATTAVVACAEKPVTTEDAVPEVQDDKLETASYSTCSGCLAEENQLWNELNSAYQALSQCIWQYGGGNPKCAKLSWYVSDLEYYYWSVYYDCQYLCGGGGGGGYGSGFGGGPSTSSSPWNPSNPHAYPTSGYPSPPFRNPTATVSNGVMSLTVSYSGTTSTTVKATFSGPAMAPGGIALVKQMSDPTSCTKDQDCHPKTGYYDRELNIDGVYNYCLKVPSGSKKCFKKVSDDAKDVGAPNFDGGVRQVTKTLSAGTYASLGCIGGSGDVVPASSTGMTAAQYKDAFNACLYWPDYAHRAYVVFTK